MDRFEGVSSRQSELRSSSRRAVERLLRFPVSDDCEYCELIVDEIESGLIEEEVLRGRR